MNILKKSFMNTNKINYKELYVSKCSEVEILNKKISSLIKDISNMNIDLSNKNNFVQEYKKGSLCSISGSNYEKHIYKIVKNCTLNNSLFNTQDESSLGGSTATNDITCNYINENDIGIEIKKYNTPDWMQCSIIYNKTTNKWEPSKKGKIPKESRELFDTLINNITLFDNKIPPFVENKITHDEWLNIKKSTHIWKDSYIDVPEDTIKKLYAAKGCQYIQVSNDYGLYHLGNDVCNFNVPEFITEQQIRVRTKIHSKKNKKGFCNISVTIACKPKNIKSLQQSNYSLDDIDKLPIKLVYVNP